MVVNYEFLGTDPIENVITCMHFAVDKVVYFGYAQTIETQRNCTEQYLKEVCGVKEVDFFPVSPLDLQSVLITMRTEIDYEMTLGSQIYFDITGGESLILVAFGMLSGEFNAPMHMYDIPEDRLIELEEGAFGSISREVRRQYVPWDVDRFIQLHGGEINYYLHKEFKNDADGEFEADIPRLWDLANQYSEYWNLLSHFFRSTLVPDENLEVRNSASNVLQALASPFTKALTPATLNRFLDSLAAEGLILDLQHSDGKYHFRFKSQEVKNCLWESGSILELMVYRNESREADVCRMGLHLDWDGIVHTEPGIDVLNEIDVFSMQGNIPSFISCKTGKMGPQQTLHALYELDTIAGRFGGKYSRKVLVTTHQITGVYLERAEEMGIEVRTEP